MYVVDLQKAAYYQKCYDPDCRGRAHFTTKVQMVKNYFILFFTYILFHIFEHLLWT